MTRIVNCPQCGGPARFSPDNLFRPFCGERCRLIDLGAWAEGRYAIAGASTESDSLGAPIQNFSETPPSA
ncbi:MAG: DNA gyrase inhibitor YacG [Betaproteobacteria bacterium]|nr:DNA gyrase inhibitor YacG [Betaproteobacteria bacterium]